MKHDKKLFCLPQEDGTSFSNLPNPPLAIVTFEYLIFVPFQFLNYYEL